MRVWWWIGLLVLVWCAVIPPMVWASTTHRLLAVTATPIRATLTSSQTRTLTNTRTSTPTRTLTNTRTITNTRTATRTFTASRTRTDTFTATNTRTATASRTASATRSKTSTRTNTATATQTRTTTATATPSITSTPSATATRLSGTLVPAEMMGLVGRDPYFEYVNNQVNQIAQERMGYEMSRLGVRWVRIDVRLPVAYTTSTPAVLAAISRYDYFITDVAPRYGIKVLVLLNFDLIMGVDANELMRGPYTDHLRYGPGYNTYMQEWMNRAWLIIARYGNRIGAIEVLNEANRLPRYTSNGPIGNAIPAHVYAQLITTLYRACHGGELQSACGTTPIVLGGLHPRGTNAQATTPARTDMAYLSDMYQSPAFTTAYTDYGRWPLDAVGYHPYPVELAQIGVPNQSTALNRMRTTLVALNDALRPVWITEIGYNVAYANQNPIIQAQFLGAVYRLYATRMLADGSPEIPVAFWFKYEDFPPASGAYAQQWGLVRIPFVTGACPGDACYAADGAPTLYRPAWYVYRDLHP